MESEIALLVVMRAIIPPSLLQSILRPLSIVSAHQTFCACVEEEVVVPYLSPTDHLLPPHFCNFSSKFNPSRGLALDLDANNLYALFY